VSIDEREASDGSDLCIAFIYAGSVFGLCCASGGTGCAWSCLPALELWFEWSETDDDEYMRGSEVVRGFVRERIEGELVRPLLPDGRGELGRSV
jgi:hypothetical protein